MTKLGYRDASSNTMGTRIKYTFVYPYESNQGDHFRRHRKIILILTRTRRMPHYSPGRGVPTIYSIFFVFSQDSYCGSNWGTGYISMAKRHLRYGIKKKRCKTVIRAINVVPFSYRNRRQYSCRYELAFNDICNYRQLCALVCVFVFDPIYSGASLRLSVYV